MLRRPPRSTPLYSSAASDVYKRQLPLDVHLMIDDPDRWAPGYAEVGANSVTFHAEAAANPSQVCRDIRRHGARVGIAVRPGTALDPYLDLLPSVDMILVMTVEPGLSLIHISEPTRLR